MAQGPVQAPLAPMDVRPVPIASPLPQNPAVPPMGPVTGENSAAVPVTIDQVMKLLRDDDMRGFRIDIETDQMVQPDEDAEKQRAIEFVTAVGQFLGEFGPMVVQMPPLAKLASNMLVFAVRRFKTGRELEDIVEQTMDEISQKLGNPAPPQMSPEDQAKVAVAQANQQTAEIRAQAEQAKAALDVKAQQDKAAAEAQRLQDEHNRALEMHAADMAAKQQLHDHQMAREEAQHRREMERHSAEMASQQFEDGMAADKHSRDLEAAALNFDQTTRDREHQAAMRERETGHRMSAAERQHEQKLEQSETAHEQAMESARHAEKSREKDED